MKKWFISILIIVLLIFVFLFMYFYLGFFHKVYSVEDFGIEVLISEYDYDDDGIDDFSDILEGAKIDARNRPNYKSAYHAGGYPPEDEGVCTDLVWRAFKNAGYSLKDLVDEDIKNNVDLYERVNGNPDPNIDFRRVANLKVFFDRNAVNLTLDPYDIENWQAGDIVIFGPNHIGIISDKRNKEGIPYILHNAGQYNREEDGMIRWYKNRGITGHYRFNKEEYLTSIKKQS